MRIFLLLALLGLAGCASLKRVDPQAVAALPLEARLDLLEAENELFVSVDNLDEARVRQVELRDDLRRGKGRLKEAREALTKVQEGKEAGQEKVAALALEESERRLTYLRDAVKLQELIIAAEEQSLRAARSRYEKKRAQAVKTSNVPGAEKVDLALFDAQVQREEKLAQELNQKLADSKASSDKLREAWAESRRALSAQTGGGQGSPWVQ